MKGRKTKNGPQNNPGHSPTQLDFDNLETEIKCTERASLVDVSKEQESDDSGIKGGNKMNGKGRRWCCYI